MAAPDNISLVLHKINELRFEQRPIPKPGQNEVLISVQKVGICGSDVHYWKHGRINNFIVKGPMVLGHEPSGIIKEVGPGVTTLKPGDRVVIEPGVPCMGCEYCKKGSYNLCPYVKFCATPPHDGTLCRYYVHHASFCHKIPDNMSLEEGALVEPLAVAIYACRRAGVAYGDTVLVTGSGPIGLVNVLVLKAIGVSKICITDIAANRLEIAKKLGADYAVLADAKDAKEMAEKVVNVLGCQPDITLECSGAEPSVQLGLLVTKTGGVLTLIGCSPPVMSLPIMEASTREVDIRGILRYKNCHPSAIDLISSGKVNVKPLITHRFELEQAMEAFEVARTGAGGAIKVMINCAK